ncbi:MAG TPA: ABC transporter ATP-binding protein [Nitrospiria bacterium]
MLIRMKEVQKSYSIGSRNLSVLKKIDLNIEEGDFIAIMGKSGSGKSSLLYLLGCMDLPSGGSYELGGIRINGMQDTELSGIRNKKIGFVFQTFNLIHQLNILENVEVPLHYRGVSARDRSARSLPLIRRVGLADRLAHTPAQLSGGEMQRVAIARALINNPVLLLADEPTGNLDSATSNQIMDLLLELNGQGKTIVMVTHDPNIASFAHKTIHLSDGVIEDR